MAKALLIALLVAGSTSCALFRPHPPQYEAETHASGLVVHDVVIPTGGATAGVGDTVSITYVIRLEDEDGQRVDSSKRHGEPLKFVLGAGEVPAGLEQGVVGMRLFGRRELIVPPELGYGKEGLQPLIPPDATLYFEIELMSVE